MSPGVASPLPRVVPSSGASIHKNFVPGGVRKRRGARAVQAANQSNRPDGGWNEQPLCASWQNHIPKSGQLHSRAVVEWYVKRSGQMASGLLQRPVKLSRFEVSYLILYTPMRWAREGTAARWLKEELVVALYFSRRINSSAVSQLLTRPGYHRTSSAVERKVQAIVDDRPCLRPSQGSWDVDIPVSKAQLKIWQVKKGEYHLPHSCTFCRRTI
jgi:hypothetical protein